MQSLTLDAATDNTYFDYDKRVNRYRDLETGRFLKKSVVDYLTEQRIGLAKTDLSTIGNLLWDGKISLSTWQSETREVLKVLHAQQYMLGIGGKAQLEKSDYLTIGRELKKQYEYLANFAQELTEGKMTLAQAKARLDLYAESGKVSYFQGEKTAQIRSGKGFARRILGMAVHCNECIEYFNRGVVPISELILPCQECSCKNRCKCSVEYLTA